MKKQKVKVSFVVKYNPKLMVDISKIFQQVDLGISRVTQIQTEIWSYETTAEVNEKYISKILKIIKQAVESTGSEFVSAIPEELVPINP